MTGSMYLMGESDEQQETSSVEEAQIKRDVCFFNFAKTYCQ